MSEKQERLQQRLQPEIEALRQQCRSLLLATRDHAGQPNVSYAPFVFHEGAYYVLVSEVARHGRNLRAVPQLSLMLIEDESASRQLFARQRLSYDATAQRVERDSDTWHQAIGSLASRHGELVHNLTKMNDFHLYCLQPTQGTYVKGFGQAFEVAADDSIAPVHLTVGHQPREPEAGTGQGTGTSK